MIDIKPLHPLFAAEVLDLDLVRGPDRETFARLKDAFERYAVLVCRGQDIADDQQIAFSEMFGELETTKVGTPGAGSKLITLTNIGADGKVLPATDKQILSNKANRQWHADSSFKAVPAYASMLSARVLPSSGGNTEFISMRDVYKALPHDLKVRIDGRVAVHDFSHSRAKIDPNIVSDEERTAVPPVRHALVLDHGPHGKSLYLGAHVARIEGYDETESRALIEALMAFAQQDTFIYSHAWRPHDLVIWHNRAVLHRATPFDSARERRSMVRTTIAGKASTLTRSRAVDC
ncbi:MAG: TauD/TfdA dioxygenase family protein, partial [Hyphomicrobiaceae bacterium]